MVTFKQIELVGFKSFADKTVIPFTDGVTCIVGPNGCGKSNVADAIRWVLGEQSAKMMRGSQMLDVIFNGTEKRRPTSFCEVTLSFDNTSRIFDIDCDEVEMTRRLYRNGDSEYLLNRQPSRMKVLTGLLHGAGAAKEGYSIIGQGRIEMIMNAKPEDRRAIFEEATGISMFKERKADAERKLAAARDNLYIFLQRMHEVEHQLGPAEKAASSAIKYEELYGKLRSLEINTYIYQHDTSAERKQKITDKIEHYNSEIERLTARSSEVLKEYERCRDVVSGADDELAELNERLLRYTVGIQQKTGEGKVLQEKANSVKEKLRSAQEDVTFSSQRIDEIEREIRRAEAYNEKNADRAAKLAEECRTAEEELSALSQEIGKFEAMNDENRKKVMDTFRDLSDLNKNMGSIEAQRELLNERLSEVQSTLAEIKTLRDGYKKDYDESIKKHGELTDFISSENDVMERAAKDVRDCEESVQTYTRRAYDARSQISSLNDSLATVKALRDRFDGYIYSVKRLMTDAKAYPEISAKIQGLIADIVTTSGDYEVAIETAFGGSMQNVVTGTRDDAKFLIEHLKRTRGGQVTFLPVEALRPRLEGESIRSARKERGAIGYAVDLVEYNKKYDNVIRYLLGNTLVCDNIENATQISRRYPRAFKIVTLDGDVINSSGSMTGGSRKDNAGNLLANERRIKEIEDGIAEKKSALARAENMREKAQAELAEKNAQLESLRERFQSSRAELAANEQLSESLLKQLSSEESRYSVFAQTSDMISSRLAALDDKYSETTRGASDLNERSTEASSAIENISTQYDALVKRRDEKLEELNSARVEKASLEAAVKSGKENTERLTSEKEELINKIARTRAAIPDIERELEELNRQAEHSALTKEEQAVVDDIRERIKATTDNKVATNERIKQIDIERLELHKSIQENTDRRNNQQIALTKLDADLENMQQRIMDEYGEDYEGCLKYKTEDFDIESAPGTVASLKRQITMLGAINPNAVEEYKQIKERYDKMASDKEDMEKAIDDLGVALDEIRQEMLRIFNEGFAKINENFKQTFKELFGGGRAELELDYTDCEDPLDAGVEIQACPPGKKLTKISLLSGGERALTAIAILFAIIGMRPMPFCVLDEIEAALDEANVGRYAKYLKKFSTETQFIVITHRKPTMENADTLFGVTMEEKGVSKIVSVKLSEVESRLGGDTVM
ncbi:MAG TPA: chromosome segregation protein SMC [Candidatus Coproplasma stercoravium]|nr:chromosome segregation protein SMC [Candidatus Coproplasma stercoravium]